MQSDKKESVAFFFQSIEKQKAAKRLPPLWKEQFSAEVTIYDF